MRDAFLGATTTYRRELMNVDFDKKGVTWWSHVHADVFAWMLQRRLHKSMCLSSDACQSGFLVCWNDFLQDAQCNSRCLLQSLLEALSMSRFLDVTATGTGWTDNLIWLWIQQYDVCIFDAEVWTLYPLCSSFRTSLYLFAWSMHCWRMSWQEGVWKYTGLCQAIVLDASGWRWIHPWIHVEIAGRTG
jgi:hypothetical protein